MKRLAIVTTHPIQYNAPLFRLLSEQKKVVLKVFYTWSQSEEGNIFDPGFGIRKQWDIPLLDGYDYTFVNNVSKEPGSHHYKGIINPTLIAELRSFSPDAIMAYGWSFVSHLKVLRYFKGKIPVYFRGDSTLLNESPGFSFKKTVRRIFLKWIYSHIDKAFYAGENNKAYFKQHGLKDDQLIFLPHAVDNDRFMHAPTANIFRETFNIPEEHLVVLYAGKLEPVKNTFVLLDAFRQLKRQDVHLVFVGKGPLEQEMRSRASHNSDIHFMSFVNQSEMPAVYHSSDVFVLPSKSETWGLAVNEAMACSLPVIVSDKCGCAPDLIRNGINGYIFRSGNAENLAGILNKVLDDWQKLAELGAASKEIISSWSFKNCVKILEDEFGG